MIEWFIHLALSTCALTLSLTVLSSAQGQTTAPATAPSFKHPGVEFVSDKFGFKLHFPDTLRIAQTDDATAALTLVPPDADVRQATIQVIVPANMRGGLPRSDLTRVYLEMFKRTMTDAKVLENGETSLGGTPAHRYVLEGHSHHDGQLRKSQLVMAANADRFYCVLAMAEPDRFDSLKKTCDAIIATFRWTQ